MKTFAELQELVLREGVILHISIYPNGAITHPDKTMVVAADNGRPLGPVIYCNDLTEGIALAMASAPWRRKAAPSTDLGDLLA